MSGGSVLWAETPDDERDDRPECEAHGDLDETFAVRQFRAKPDDDSDGPPIHGHTGLEILWTAVPTLLVTAIAVVSAVVLAKDDAQGADPLRIEVTAQQFYWSYTYPSYANKTSSVLRLPV